MTARRHVVGLVAIFAVGGCAAQMYAGPHRSSSEVAVVETDGTVITGADEGGTGSWGKVAVLPGLRALRVRLDDEHPNGMTRLTVRSSKESAVVCFVARAGHTYTTRPVYAEGTWRPEMIDQTTTERVRTEAFGGENPLCAPDNDQQGYAERHRPIVAPLPILLY